MNNKTKWIKDAFRLSFKLLQAQWAPLLALFAVSAFLNITFEDAMQLSTPSDEGQRWILQLILGVWDLFEGILLILILSWGIPMVRALTAATLLERPFSEPYLHSFLAEYLRVLAQVLMWGLLLLLPGFGRYCQLIFVPYITIFSRNYRAGEVDALKLSKQLVRGRMILIAVTIAVTMGLQVGTEFLPEMLPDLHILPMRVAMAVFSFLISTWAYALIFLLFEDAMERLRPEEN